MQPFVYADETIRIDLGDGLWIDLKKELSYGDQQKLTSNYMVIKTVSDIDKINNLQSTEFDLEKGNIALLITYICAWNFTDKDGSTAPIDEKHIRMLKAEIATKILEAIRTKSPLALGLPEKKN